MFIDIFMYNFNQQFFLLHFNQQLKISILSKGN